MHWHGTLTCGFACTVRELTCSHAQATVVQFPVTLLRRVWRRLDGLLGSRGFITLPSAPGPAPLKNLAAGELDAFRTKALALTSIAGLCGMPQVSIPCATMGGLPVGLGIIAPRGKDAELLQLTVDLAAVLLPKA